MEERSGLSDNGRFVAAVIRHSKLCGINDIFALSEALRSDRACVVRLGPFVQLRLFHAVASGAPERWYSYRLRCAIDELVERGAVVRFADGSLQFVQGLLTEVVKEIGRINPEALDCSLAISKAGEALRAFVG
jgi:hypothetical protein